LKCGECIV